MTKKITTIVLLALTGIAIAVAASCSPASSTTGGSTALTIPTIRP